MPAPTSVLWGSQTAQPTDAQYSWRREIASWKVGAPGLILMDDVLLGWMEGALAVSIAAALVRTCREVVEEKR